MTRLHAVIRGQVHGVGYRHFVATRARALGLTGWVRNRPDGTVEVVAEGEDAALRALTSDLGRGPSSAQVDAVEDAWSPSTGVFRAFEITR
jgi:acylphosphatase